MISPFEGDYLNIQWTVTLAFPQDAAGVPGPGERISPRRPWLAGLLQLVTPGLGNIYCGRPVRGLILFLVPYGSVFAASLLLAWWPSLLTLVIVGIGIVAVPTFNVVDGVRCAKSAKPNYRLARYNRWYIYGVVIAAVFLTQSAVVSLIVGWLPVHAFRIPNPSMERTGQIDWTWDKGQPNIGQLRKGNSLKRGESRNSPSLTVQCWVVPCPMSNRSGQCPAVRMTQ
jgi:hypothetical protein